MLRAVRMSDALQFDAATLRRYDKPGPRYTSYPTAPHFGPQFTEAMLREHVHRTNLWPIPRRLSLYVHVPFCFSPCFYCGCNRIITRDVSRAAPYLARLQRELAMIGALFDRNREVVQVHLGGGTPNFMRPADIGALLATADDHFRLSDSAERDFSIELDPRHVQAGDVAQYARMGFNRASLGVQDFDPEVQRAVNRIQSVEETLRVIDACRAEGFRSVNVDLIYGLPKQTIAGFSRTLDTVLAARPHRLAVYSYAHLPAMFKAQRQIEDADLPDNEAKLGLLALAIEKLSRAGYLYIGMDHFALPDDDLSRAQEHGSLQRNFMGYTTHADCDLVGLGMSAISHIGESFSQNARDLPGWQSAVDSGHLPVWRGRELYFDDALRGEVIQQLMCQGRIDMPAIEARFAIDFPSYFATSLAQLRPLAGDGLVMITNRSITATARGRLLLRVIAMCFDRYLDSAPLPATRPQFSRVI
ncbi:MAG TPA: oxygen-independent coproporphyrinogen III oxidase [Steroidobacteraceae bacterium]|jgi:oxygen-independent coproporphyrinogen-3 oxidase|nr:oxygen-independent coproporphyrinogen III oxidase [Steroidobacteraceae bacterium]